MIAARARAVAASNCGAAFHDVGGRGQQELGGFARLAGSSCEVGQVEANRAKYGPSFITDSGPGTSAAGGVGGRGAGSACGLGAGVFAGRSGDMEIAYPQKPRPKTRANAHGQDQPPLPFRLLMRFTLGVYIRKRQG